MVFTADEEKILKAFVAQLKSVGKEVKKSDGIVREVNFNSMIKNAVKEEI